MKRKGSGILTKIIIIVLLVYATVSLVQLREKIETSRESVNAMQAAVDKKAAENEDMAYAIEHSTEDEVIKEVARDKLGLVEYDEKVFVAN